MNQERKMTQMKAIGRVERVLQDLQTRLTVGKHGLDQQCVAAWREVVQEAQAQLADVDGPKAVQLPMKEA